MSCERVREGTDRQTEQRREREREEEMAMEN